MNFAQSGQKGKGEDEMIDNDTQIKRRRNGFIGKFIVCLIELMIIFFGIAIIIKWHTDGGFVACICFVNFFALFPFAINMFSIHMLMDSKKKYKCSDVCNDDFCLLITCGFIQTVFWAGSLACYLGYVVHGDKPGCFDANSFVYILNDDDDDNDKDKNNYCNGKNNLGICKNVQSVEYNYNNYNYNSNYKEIKVGDIQVDDKILCIDPISKKLIWDKVKFRLHYHWYNNKNEFVLMKRIYVSKNEFITMTYDHLIYIKKSSHNYNNYNYNYEIIKCQDIKIGDILYYFNCKKNKLIFKSVIKIENNILCNKRSYFGLSPFVLVNNIIASPFAATTKLNDDEIDGNKIHCLKYKFLIQYEMIWKSIDDKVKFPLFVKEFIKSFVGLFGNYIDFFIFLIIFFFFFLFCLFMLG